MMCVEVKAAALLILISAEAAFKHRPFCAEFDIETEVKYFYSEATTVSGFAACQLPDWYCSCTTLNRDE